jgi:alkylation response protein AidB-like acyl-CoA dehydrogenase
MLSAQLLELVPGAAEVRGVEQLTGGASRETWSFDALIDAVWTPLVLRSGRVSMCNHRANRLACDAADRAMQVHGGLGYTRAKPFEHIYRHHRRYRITEGSEEMQIRNVAGHLFGFIRR